jgi:hypothetical protein
MIQAGNPAILPLLAIEAFGSPLSFMLFNYLSKATADFFNTTSATDI